MSSPVSTSTTYYLYVSNAWSGPFDLGQIRFFLRQHQVAPDTYAYDHERQQHHTVGELLAGHEDSSSSRAVVSAPDPVIEGARPVTRVFRGADETYRATTTTATATFDNLGPDLRSLYQSYLDLTEDRTLDRAGSLRALRDHGSALAIQLSAAVHEPATLRDLCAQVARVGDYLANRHQDHALWDRLEVLNGAHPDNDPDDAAAAASAVIDVIREKAERAKAGVKAEIVDEASDRWEQPGLRTVKGIIADARAELVRTVEELQKVQKAYADLQDESAAEIDAARDAVAAAESRRADEEAARRQVLAEIRSLSAEIHRLGQEHLAGDPGLREDLGRLAEELAGDNATAMVPLAEGLLIRLVTRLRSIAGGETGDLARLREDLAEVRAELVQARAQTLVLTEERDRLRRQIEEQRQAAERAMNSAREREQRLRSTVAAMEVTRDLHQDVMRELEVQLTSAQGRVTEMEGELSTTRGELQTTRHTLDEKSSALQDEMRRAVELKAMLEARREELSTNLRHAEAELQKAQGDTQAADPEFVEALAAKVNHLRTTFETTKRKLDEQRALAIRLEEELAQSRREAQELRGRSDSLSTELDDARANLSSAKRRFDELQRAYARLEQERESLQQEVNRKGTDTIARETTSVTASSASSRLNAQSHSGTQRLAKVVSDLETRVAEGQRRLDQAGIALEQERDRARQAQERLESLSGAIEELTAERNHLRQELDQLHAQHFSEHSRNAAALATATQATIDAERRAKEAMARVVELEQELADASESSALEPIIRPAPGLGDARAELARLRAEAEALRAERDRLAAAAAAPKEGTARLAAVDDRLARAIAERDEQAAAVQTATAEAERLSRELARLRNEHESAAVEHRAALKSARDRLAEAQTRIQTLEREIEERRGDAGRTDALQTERDRLVAELARAQASLAAVAAGQPAQERLLAELADAGRALAAERERVQTLEAAAAEARRAGDEAQRRAVNLEERGDLAAADRDRLTLEIERLKGELAMAQAAGVAARSADAARTGDVERRLAEIIADREHLIAQLGQLNGELTVARQRLARMEADAIGVERLALEQSRVKELEARLNEARQDHQSALTMAADARTRLAQVHVERDRLQVEVERLRAAGGAGGVDAAELADLRARIKRLVRSRRKLRAERDELKQQLERALAAVQTSGSSASHPAIMDEIQGEALDPLPLHTQARSGLTPRQSGTPLAGATLSGSRPSVVPSGLTGTILRPAATGQFSTRTVGSSRVTALVPRPEVPAPATVAPRLQLPWRRVLPWAAAGLSTTLMVAWIAAAPISHVALVDAAGVVLTAPSSGVLKDLVAPGLPAQQGQVVGRIENSDPDRTELDQATATRDTAASARLRAETYLEELQRQGRNRAAATDADAARAAADLAAAEASVADARAVHDRAIARVAEAEQRRRALMDVPLASPVPSVVWYRRRPTGSTVHAGDTVVTLADPSTLHVAARFPASLRVAPGTVVRVAIGGQILIGTVRGTVAGGESDRVVGLPAGDGPAVVIDLPVGSLTSADLGAQVRVLPAEGPVGGLRARLRALVL